MIVAGLELTRIVRTPSARSARQACVPAESNSAACPMTPGPLPLISALVGLTRSARGAGLAGIGIVGRRVAGSVNGGSVTQKSPRPQGAVVLVAGIHRLLPGLSGPVRRPHRTGTRVLQRVARR